MADDVTLPGSGAVIATDDIGSGRQAQLVKQVFGGDGSATMVTASAGLPVQSGYFESTGSAAANNTDLVSADVSGYRWVSVQITGTFSATVSYQQSNDNANWLPCALTTVNTTSPSGSFSTTSSSLQAGPICARYFRVRTTSYASGTATATVGFFANPGSFQTIPAYLNGSSAAIPVSGSSNATDANTGTGLAPVYALQAGYNGANFDRWRNPNRVFTVAATESGDTALWQPGSSNRWRLQRVKFDITADATITSGGVLTISLRDATTAIGVTQSVYVPATGATTLNGDWTSGWIDLGNGIQSSGNNQDLNVNLSAALATGTCRVLACGTQGAGTAA